MLLRAVGSGMQTAWCKRVQARAGAVRSAMLEATQLSH